MGYPPLGFALCHGRQDPKPVPLAVSFLCLFLKIFLGASPSLFEEAAECSQGSFVTWCPTRAGP
jgi:hypothetical protein